MQKSRSIEIVGRTDQQVVADHNGSDGGEILLVEIRNDFVPTLLAGFSVERHQVIVRGFEVEPILVHTHATIADVRSPLGLPEVVPEDGAIAGVDGPRVVGYRDVEDPVHLQDPA